MFSPPNSVFLKHFVWSNLNHSIVYDDFTTSLSDYCALSQTLLLKIGVRFQPNFSSKNVYRSFYSDNACTWWVYHHFSKGVCVCVCVCVCVYTYRESHCKASNNCFTLFFLASPIVNYVVVYWPCLLRSLSSSSVSLPRSSQNCVYGLSFNLTFNISKIIWPQNHYPLL